jgi:DNA primase
MNTRPERDRIAKINEHAAAFYRAQLLAPPHTGPRAYLASRGFNELLGDSPWTVGYAPDSWTALHDHLAHSGYSDQAMLDAGLISIGRRGTPIDRFRNRVTFGIRTADSLLVGFTCRAAPGARETTPKYLNTPRTAAYDKSAVLFGIGEATRHQPGGTTVMVEGPLDAIAVSFAGGLDWKPLALCGTSMTPQHAHVVSRLACPVVLAFDEDLAGHRALEGAAIELASIAGEPHAISMAAGQDPAALFASFGPTALQDVLERTRPVSDLLLDRLLQTDVTHNVERALLVLRRAARSLTRVGTADMARHAARLCQTLRLEPSTVTRELAAAQSSPSHGKRNARNVDAARVPSVLNDAEQSCRITGE